jgi:FlaA1/EpsC-like NDP-sugar epimerase
MAGRLSRVCTKGLTVLVTGGTSGFGEATARRFIAEGSRVCKPYFMVTSNLSLCHSLQATYVVGPSP